MIFRIVDFNKELNIYNVISNEGEQKNVTSFQIVNVLLQGYQFDNAYLTQKGFAVKTNTGTRYIQVNMDRGTQALVMKFLNRLKVQEQQRLKMIAEKKRLEEEARRADEQRKIAAQSKQEAENLKRSTTIKKQIQRPVVVASAPSAPSSSNKTTKIHGNNGKQKIYYKGNLYYSEEQLCNKFNANINEFKKLRAKGYSIDEALGLKPLRPENELVSLKQLNKVLDSMAAQRGEY